MDKSIRLPSHILAEVLDILSEIPENNREGFLNIAEHMGNFSGVFATGASRATSVRERMNSAGEFGLTSLKLNMNRTFREIASTITLLDGLTESESALTDHLVRTVEWGYSLEQAAILPPITDQIKVKSSESLELQSLAAILDNLLHQMRPLIAELISGGQQAHALTSHLKRRLVAELDSSRQGLARLKRNTKMVLATMDSQVEEISKSCTAMEERSARVTAALGELVQAMQYDDITTQRVQHAAIALEQVGRKIAADPEAQVTRRWAVLALRIVVDQLEESSADLVTAIRTVHQQLHGIFDEAVDQAKEIQVLRGVGLTFRQGVAEMIHHLNATLRLGIFDDALPGDFLRVVSQAENGIFQAKRGLGALALSARRMENLAASLGHRGTERMQILTGTILDLSRRVLAEKEAINKELTISDTLLQSISAEFTEKIMPTLLRTNAMLRRMPLSIQQVDNHNTENLAALSENLAEAQSTSIQIMLLSAEATFHITFQKQTHKVVETLQTIIHNHEDADTLEINQALLAAEFQDLANLYTMDSERRVLQQALNLDTLADTAAVGEEDEDGFELF